jgi:hypothetical protein
MLVLMPVVMRVYPRVAGLIAVPRRVLGLVESFLPGARVPEISRALLWTKLMLMLPSPRVLFGVPVKTGWRWLWRRSHHRKQPVEEQNYQQRHVTTTVFTARYRLDAYIKR